MKTVRLTLFCALFSFAFAACEKPADDTDNSSAAARFAAKVEGKAFATGDEPTTAKYVSSTKMLQIVGSTADSKETIIISLMPPYGRTFNGWTKGTYDFNPDRFANSEYLAAANYNMWDGAGYQMWSTNYELNSNGQLVITDITDTHVTGTFYFDLVKQNNNGTFDGANIKKVTEGKFDLDIKKQ